MRAEQTSFLFGANAPFIEELYAKFLADPSSVDAEWQTFFGALAGNSAAKPPAWAAQPLRRSSRSGPRSPGTGTSRARHDRRLSRPDRVA